MGVVVANSNDNPSTEWQPAEKVNILGDYVEALVLYASYITGKAYDVTEDTTHLHASFHNSELVYTYNKTTTDSSGKETTTSYSTKFNFYQLNYDKQIYHPGCITIKMKVTGGTASIYAEILKKLFLTHECTIYLVGMFNNGTVTDTSDDYYFAIARYYYVQKASLTYESGTAIATLLCYSPDNKLRKDKFCKVYTGKRLACDIFESVVGSLKSNNANVFTKCTEEPTKVTTPSYYVNSENLCFLGYGNTDLVSSKQSKTNTGTSELLQPYLLQYNESTYDFLCRVANRCGEFLYYDQGVLRLGLPSNTLKAINSDTSSASCTVISPTYTSYKDISLDEDTNITTKLFTENALQSDKATSAVSGTNYYNAEATDDENLYPYQVNKDDDSPTSIDPFVDEAVVLDVFANFCKMQKLSDIATNILINAIVTKIVSCYTLPLFGSMMQVGGMLSDYKSIYNAASNKDKVTALWDLYNNLCNFFYTELEALEHDASAKTIEMDFDSIVPEISLGDAVTIKDADGSKYIVTEIHGEFISGSHSHTVKAVPLIQKATRTGTSQKYSTASDTESLIIVPPYAVPHTIKGEPQKAIIRDTADPLRMGRVRITYPWQDAKNMDLDDGDTDYSEGYSPWIKMITPFAGDEANQGGIFMKPALGTHVIVNYFNDNMEDPYVRGSLYFKKNSAPGYKWEYSGLIPTLATDDEKVAGQAKTAYEPSTEVRTIQSAAGHGITFFDGEPGSFLSDHVLPLFSFATQWLPDSAKGCNTGGMVLSDQSGIYKIVLNAGNRTIDIHSPVGNVNINAFTGINISAPNGELNITGKNVTVKAGNNITFEAGANIKKSKDVDTRTLFEKSFYELMPLGLVSLLSTAEKCALNNSKLNVFGMNLLNMSDLTFLRASWEVIMRPVEGTMSFSTPRNVIMTAGKGEAFIPSYLMSEETSGFSGLTGKQMQLATNDPVVVTRIAKLFELARSAVFDYFNRHVVALHKIDEKLTWIYTRLTAKKSGYLSALKDKVYLDNSGVQNLKGLLLNGDDPKTKKQLYEAIKCTVNENGRKTPKPSASHILGITPTIWTLHELRSHYNSALHAYNDIFVGKDKDNLEKFIKFVNSKLKYSKLVTKETIFIEDSDIAGWNKTNVCATATDNLYNDDSIFNKDAVKVNIAVYHKICICVFYSIINQLVELGFLNKTANLVLNLDTCTLENWLAYIDNLTLPAPAEADNSLKSLLSSTWSKALDKAFLVSKLDEAAKLVSWNGCAGPRAKEDVTTGGRIIMSSSQDKTLMTNDDGSSFVPKDNPSIDTIKSFLKYATSPSSRFVENNQYVPNTGILWNPDNIEVPAP